MHTAMTRVVVGVPFVVQHSNATRATVDAARGPSCHTCPHVTKLGPSVATCALWRTRLVEQTTIGGRIVLKVNLLSLVALV